MSEKYDQPGPIPFENHALFPNVSKNGICFAAVLYQRRYEELETDAFNPRDSDVTIATYGKSGTTWLETLVYTLLGCPNGPIEKLDEQIPWLQTVLHSLEEIEKMKSPRVFKTHDYFSWLPEKTKNTGKIIHCMRNVKDQCVSYYHHLINLDKAYNNMTGHYTFDEYFQKIHRSRKVAEAGLWEEHAIDWLSQKGRDNILFVTYEDLSEDTERELKKIAAFLGLPEDQEAIDRALKKGKFDNMKKDKSLNCHWAGQNFIRKGKVGGWVDTLSEEQSKILDEAIEKVVAAGGNVRCTLE